MLIKKIIREFAEDSIAYKETKLYVLNFLIFSKLESSTSTNIINTLTQVKPIKIKGFKNETKN